VWKREGDGVRELPIRDGWDILDDNLLACSEGHIRAVFAMLARQPHKAKFTGGLEVKRLKPWHCEELRKLKPQRLYFAYDTPDDLEPLREAGKILRETGFTTASHTLSAYVLCGWPNDTMEMAENRMRETIEAGFTPMAMLWRDPDGKRGNGWLGFQKRWARPAIIYASNRRLPGVVAGAGRAGAGGG
jgi:hypothetical protein